MLKYRTAIAPDGEKCMLVDRPCQGLNRFNRNKSKLFEICAIGEHRTGTNVLEPALVQADSELPINVASSYRTEVAAVPRETVTDAFGSVNVRSRESEMIVANGGPSGSA
jgi:hypothetical protein